MTLPPDRSHLTISEVASFLRVSKMTVYRLVHSGELPAVRIRRQYRIVRADVLEYLRQAQAAQGVPGPDMTTDQP